MGLAYYYNYWADPSPFGYEYGNIATSLSTGQGFSNPFGVESGPTAWMPPFYVYLLSSVFLVFGVKSMASMWVILFLEAVALTFTCYMLVKIAEETPYVKCKYLIILTFLLPLMMSQRGLFMGLHDMWLMVFSSVFIVFTIVRFIKEPEELSLFQLSIVAFFLPLLSPSLSLGFAVAVATYAFITAVKIARTPNKELSFASFNTSKILRYSVLTGVVFLISMGSWTMRNFNEFGKFIPVKSNFWYDFYQANYIDADGVVSSSTFMTAHPLGNTEVLKNYSEKGEVEFINEYERKTRYMMSKSKGIYFEKMANRLKNAIIFTKTENDLITVKADDILPGDLKTLNDNMFILKERWVNLEHDKSVVLPKIQSMNLEEPEKIAKHWTAAQLELKQKRKSFFNQLRGYTVSLIPFLCILGILFFSRYRSHPVFAVTLIVYVVHLIPYVFISHYMRYQVPLVAFQAVFSFFIVGTVFNKYCVFETKDKQPA